MEQVEQQVEQLSIEKKEETQQGEEQQQAKLTPNQLKKLKQKQKKALQKQEEEKLAQEKQNNEGEDQPKEEVDQFQLELQWCIKQLKLGIERNNLDKDQIQESNKVINKLESDKTALIAKRHLMKVVFGDYRKLMKMMK